MNDRTYGDIEKRIGRELTIDEICEIGIRACELRGKMTIDDAIALINA